jgi:hypothetical protein
MYIYAPAPEAAAPTVFMVWQRACPLHVTVPWLTADAIILVVYNSSYCIRKLLGYFAAGRSTVRFFYRYPGHRSCQGIPRRMQGFLCDKGAVCGVAM